MRKSCAAVAALALAAAVGLSACGGGRGNSTGVASLSGSKAGATTTTLPKGNATQLYDQWAQCLRDHGVAGLADPTINSQGQLNLTLPQGISPQSLPRGLQSPFGGKLGFTTDQPKPMR